MTVYFLSVSLFSISLLNFPSKSRLGPIDGSATTGVTMGWIFYIDFQENPINQ